MTNLEIALESVRGQMHYAQGHLPLFEEIIKEFDQLSHLILAYKDRIDPLIQEYEERQKHVAALISPNHDPVELTPVPALLDNQATIYGEGAETDPTPSPEVPAFMPPLPPTPTETAPVAEVEPPAAVPELKSIPDLLATSPDPVTAAPTTAE